MACRSSLRLRRVQGKSGQSIVGFHSCALRLVDVVDECSAFSWARCGAQQWHGREPWAVPSGTVPSRR